MTTRSTTTRRLRAVVCAALAVLCTTVPTGAAQAAEHGDYTEYYSHFDTGPAYIPFVDTKWVPQGLTKWGEDQLVISYYDSSGSENSRIAVTDRSTGDLVKWLKLDTKGHVGGLAMTSSHLWVASGGSLRRYSRSALGSTASGGQLTVQTSVDVLGSASYAFAQGDTVWVGNFTWNYDSFGNKVCPSYNASSDWDWMYQYRVNSDGSLTYLQDRRTPGAVQGVAVTSEKLIWSTSCGRDNDSRIVVWNRDYAFDANWDHGNVIVAPNMSEGMVIAGGRLQVVYESGSAYYSDADYRVRTVHHGVIPPY